MSAAQIETEIDGLKINTALRFYHEILGLEQLHYGLWQGDNFDMEGLKIAQERYSEHLIAYFPEDVKVVLDVGAGTGATSEKLKNKGFDIEALSPDPYQKHLFAKNRDVHFHLSKFEEFKARKKYDLVLMSESCQYIPMNRLFSTVKQCAAGGYLLIDDYFITHPDDTAMSKSGHDMNTFYDMAKQNGFELLKEEDITDQAAVSLDLAKSWLNRFVLPTLELFFYSCTKKQPFMAKMVRWLMRKKVQKFNNDLMLLDAEHFKRVKRYKIMLFKVPA